MRQIYLFPCNINSHPVLSAMCHKCFHAAMVFNHLNPELNPICCLLALLDIYLTVRQIYLFPCNINSHPVLSAMCHKCFHAAMVFNPLNPELNPICCLLALLGAHHFLHVSRIKVKSLTLRLQTKLRGLSPRANYTDRAAAAGRRS